MTNKQINIIFIVALVASFGVFGLGIYLARPFTEYVSKDHLINHYVEQCEYICDSLMSKAYFEGQKDAINGDVRIAIKDSVYIWTKSCWNDGTKPLFNPTKDDTYN